MMALEPRELPPGGSSHMRGLMSDFGHMYQERLRALDDSGDDDALPPGDDVTSRQGVCMVTYNL